MDYKTRYPDPDYNNGVLKGITNVNQVKYWIDNGLLIPHVLYYSDHHSILTYYAETEDIFRLLVESNMVSVKDHKDQFKTVPLFLCSIASFETMLLALYKANIPLHHFAYIPHAGDIDKNTTISDTVLRDYMDHSITINTINCNIRDILLQSQTKHIQSRGGYSFEQDKEYPFLPRDTYDYYNITYDTLQDRSYLQEQSCYQYRLCDILLSYTEDDIIYYIYNRYNNNIYNHNIGDNNNNNKKNYNTRENLNISDTRQDTSNHTNNTHRNINLIDNIIPFLLLSIPHISDDCISLLLNCNNIASYCNNNNNSCNNNNNSSSSSSSRMSYSNHDSNNSVTSQNKIYKRNNSDKDNSSSGVLHNTTANTTATTMSTLPSFLKTYITDNDNNIDISPQYYYYILSSGLMNTFNPYIIQCNILHLDEYDKRDIFEAALQFNPDALIYCLNTQYHDNIYVNNNDDDNNNKSDIDDDDADDNDHSDMNINDKYMKGLDNNIINDNCIVLPVNYIDIIHYHIYNNKKCYTILIKYNIYYKYYFGNAIMYCPSVLQDIINENSLEMPTIKNATKDEDEDLLLSSYNDDSSNPIPNTPIVRSPLTLDIVNIPTIDDIYPIHIATQNAVSFYILIYNNANINIHDHNTKHTIHYIAQNNNIELIKYILSLSNNLVSKNMSPLDDIGSNTMVLNDTVQLSSSGDDANFIKPSISIKDSLFITCNYPPKYQHIIPCHSDIIHTMIDINLVDNDGKTPFIYAYTYYRYNMVKYLLENGAREYILPYSNKPKTNYYITSNNNNNRINNDDNDDDRDMIHEQSSYYYTSLLDATLHLPYKEYNYIVYQLILLLTKYRQQTISIYDYNLITKEIYHRPFNLSTGRSLQLIIGQHKILLQCMILQHIPLLQCILQTLSYIQYIHHDTYHISNLKLLVDYQKNQFRKTLAELIYKGDDIHTPVMGLCGSIFKNNKILSTKQTITTTTTFTTPPTITATAPIGSSSALYLPTTTTIATKTNDTTKQNTMLVIHSPGYTTTSTNNDNNNINNHNTTGVVVPLSQNIINIEPISKNCNDYITIYSEKQVVWNMIQYGTQYIIDIDHIFESLSYSILVQGNYINDDNTNVDNHHHAEEKDDESEQKINDDTTSYFIIYNNNSNDNILKLNNLLTCIEGLRNIKTLIMDSIDMKIMMGCHQEEGNGHK